jgi:hypothetical protein
MAVAEAEQEDARRIVVYDLVRGGVAKLARRSDPSQRLALWNGVLNGQTTALLDRWKKPLTHARTHTHTYLLQR